MTEYSEAKELTKELVAESVVNGYSAKQAVSAALEESVMDMLGSDVVYAAVFLNLGIISMSNGFLPDYFLSRLDKVRNLKLYLSDEDLKLYHEDVALYNSLLAGKEFVININTEYNERVCLILSE